MKNNISPPEQIDGATVLHWAWAESGFFCMRDTDGNSVATVHGLAVCQYPEGQVYRFSCDSNWETVNDCDYPTVRAALTAASGNYDISLVVWQNVKGGIKNTVWIFHGEKAKFASAVFANKEDGLTWAAKHSVSGLLTEYPVGDGCFDIAVSDGHFRLSKPHHGTPEHVAQFSPGWTEHIHLESGRNAGESKP